MKFFNALSQITRYGSQKGDNTVARMKQLNDIISNMIPSYAVTPASGDIAKSEKNSRQVLNSPLVSTVYNVTLNKDVTKLLEAGKKINIANLNANDFGFTIESIRLVVGAGLSKYDGGDLEIYLGNTLVSKVKAEVLVAVKEGESAEFISKLETAYKIGSGSYSLTEGANISYDSLLNVRLSSQTTDFDGILGFNIFTASRAADCGTYCDKCAGGFKGSAGLKCVSGKCQFCPTTKFDGADVIGV